MFDGLRFDEEEPYTYREAKRLIRLLGDLLKVRKDLHGIGIAPDGKRRPAITGKGTDAVWDFLPLVVAREAKQFTAFPHLTMSINGRHAVAAITVPNGVTGGFRTIQHSCPVIRSPQAVELFADAWKAMSPILGLVLGE